MNFLQSRVFRSGGYSALYVLVFVAILAAANWLGVQYNETYDATSRKLYSLSDQTHKILDNLDRDVTMSYFDRTTQFEGGGGTCCGGTRTLPAVSAWNTSTRTRTRSRPRQ